MEPKLAQNSPKNDEKSGGPEMSFPAEMSKLDQPLNIVTDENEDQNDKFDISGHQDFSPKELDDV